MLQLSEKLTNISVLSLRTGGSVATVTRPIINPKNLKIEGFLCADAYTNDVLILLTIDIREIVDGGFIVDDHEVLSKPEDLIRLKDIVELQFELTGKTVRTTTKEKIGKVNDFATDFSSFYIQKLYVSQSIFKHLASGSLVVERTNIVDINDHEIVINEPLRGTPVTVSAA